MKGPGFLSRFLPSPTVLFSGFLLFAASAVELTGAPTVLGPNKCTSCHDHDKQKQWADKDTHTKGLEQLEDAEGKAKKYLAALGLSDPYNLKGPCVACHTTVFNGDANAGVSCETCHGPGSAYLEPHQKKGSHKESVTQGLIDTRESYTAWANLCIGCHVVTDRKLTAAGHSSGADFELAVKSKKLRESSPGVKHWEPAYEDSKLADSGRAAMRARTGGIAPPKSEPRPQATAPPAATASPARAATVTKPQPKVSPTSAPASVRPTVEERSPTRPAPTLTATKPSPKVSPTPVPEVSVRPTVTEKPTARPTATETAVALPTQRSTPAAARTAAPAQSPAASTPSIVIIIEATPVPTLAPRVREIPPAATALEMAPQETPSPRPTPRPTHRKPRPRPTARPQPSKTPQPAQPQPTPSPTRVRAPATMSVPH
jgi:hypothetical protein